jgi:hypothetical protein
MGIPIKKYFPDYQGNNTDLQRAQEFFAEKFRRASRNPDRELHIHFGSATDTITAKELINSLEILMAQRASKTHAFQSSNSLKFQCQDAASLLQ